MNVLKEAADPALGLLLAVILCVVVFCELRFPYYELSEITNRQDRVLREAPEAAITDADWALLDALWEVPGLRETEDVLPFAEHSEFLEAALPYLDQKIAESAYVSVWNREETARLYVGWTLENGRRVTLEQNRPLDEYGIWKHVAVLNRAGTNSKRTYENKNGESMRRFDFHRVWLGYLRDLIWEDKNVSSSGTE